MFVTRDKTKSDSKRTPRPYTIAKTRKAAVAALETQFKSITGDDLSKDAYEVAEANGELLGVIWRMTKGQQTDLKAGKGICLKWG